MTFESPGKQRKKENSIKYTSKTHLILFFFLFYAIQAPFLMELGLEGPQDPSVLVCNICAMDLKTLPFLYLY